ncbi:16S rRNA (uracil(1498)-N(3))-methyltransferase [Streptomyces triticirhizae]|uniref:Ribosomal RNA small subunit methyltransferase E n=1 Tax=Streptomyces triticirhizae TaxID=2483353 RepID=A0A3M2LU78_9ACTN|nr:16S rRNA (uracil(1498)-N(3))-methyltransferase [Streptomyces triticirhizae]RMI40947.1 16S rRNA (uracil(1498)-N(3))-methyltransferase [Streptomyces triticirhizae]
MSSAPVFLVGSLAGAEPGASLTLDGAEGRHAVAVRRLRVGEEVVLSDGAGAGWLGRVAEVGGRDRLEVTALERRAEPEPSPHITVVQALPKGDRGELAVSTMTETGVDAVVPWAADRCVTQWRGERGAKSLARWRAAAREAAKQARRLRVPEVTEVRDAAGVARLLADAAFAGVLHESATLPLATARLPAEGRLVLVVGPEGGITEAELTAFAAAGATPYRLGPTVLRTSTAGPAATALLLTRTGRWG